MIFDTNRAQRYASYIVMLIAVGSIAFSLGLMVRK